MTEERRQELEAIARRYRRREDGDRGAPSYEGAGWRHVEAERQRWYLEFMRRSGLRIAEARLLEIGAGSGENLRFFHESGIPWRNLAANELLADRVERLAAACPDVTIHAGDASRLEIGRRFEVVLQSTVLSSILDPDFRRAVADRMFALCEPGGLCLWYDMRVGNPRNPDVCGLDAREIERLFPEARRIETVPVTLAPPIARRIGAAYPFVNRWMPFLRTHLVAGIYK